MSISDLQGHLAVRVTEAIIPCRVCTQPIRLARKLGKRNPLNRWCRVPSTLEPGIYQLPAASVHTCPDDKRRTPLRGWHA
jgi:hypothetical protein